MQEPPPRLVDEAFRTRCLSEIPDWYRPWAHFALPAIFGISVIAVALSLLRDTSALDLLTLPAVLVVSNAVEWWAHKNLLHKRRWWAASLFDQHTPRHHRLYLTDSMAIREWRELRLVLIPAYGIVLIAISTLPLTGALIVLGLGNVGLIFLATAVGYMLAYEWLHLSYHLPASHPVAKTRLIRFLSRHHAIHHHPQRMQRWNFNVTLPLWDLILRTHFGRVSSPTPGAKPD